MKKYLSSVFSVVVVTCFLYSLSYIFEKSNKSKIKQVEKNQDFKQFETPSKVLNSHKLKTDDTVFDLNTSNGFNDFVSKCKNIIYLASDFRHNLSEHEFHLFRTCISDAQNQKEFSGFYSQCSNESKTCKIDRLLIKSFVLNFKYRDFSVDQLLQLNKSELLMVTLAKTIKTARNQEIDDQLVKLTNRLLQIFPNNEILEHLNILANISNITQNITNSEYDLILKNQLSKSPNERYLKSLAVVRALNSQNPRQELLIREKTYPDDAEVQYALAALDYQNNDYDGSLTRLNKIRKSKPEIKKFDQAFYSVKNAKRNGSNAEPIFYYNDIYYKVNYERLLLD